MPSTILQPLGRQWVTHLHYASFAARARDTVEADNGLRRLVCHHWQRECVTGNGLAHLWQAGFATGIRQPTVMADAHEARWQYVLQEAAQEPNHRGYTDIIFTCFEIHLG